MSTFLVFNIFSFSSDLLRHKLQSITLTYVQDTVWLTLVIIYSHVTTTTIKIQNIFITKKGSLEPLCSRSLPCTLIVSHPWSAFCTVLPFPELHANKIIQYVVFSFSFMLFESHPLCCVCEYFTPLYYQVVFHCCLVTKSRLTLLWPHGL